MPNLYFTEFKDKYEKCKNTKKEVVKCLNSGRNYKTFYVSIKFEG